MRMAIAAWLARIICLAGIAFSVRLGWHWFWTIFFCIALVSIWNEDRSD